jgi:hypothetical protein
MNERMDIERINLKQMGLGEEDPTHNSLAIGYRLLAIP